MKTAIIIILLFASICFGDTYTSHQKPNTDGTLDIGTSSLFWRYIYGNAFTDGIFTVSGGIISAGTWNGTPIDISDYTNLNTQTPVSLMGDTIWLDTPVEVQYGGTGAITLSDGFVLLGNGTSAIQTLDVTTDGGIIIGDGTTDPVVLDVGSSTAITILGTIATGTWQATDIDVQYGGTGVSTLTDGGVLLGSGTNAVTAMTVLADSEFIVGDGTTDPVAESGNTARTSLGLGTGDSPTFTDVTATGTITTDIFIVGSNAPAHEADTGTVGTITYDSNYIYVCVATDTWKKVAIATWTLNIMIYEDSNTMIYEDGNTMQYEG